MQAVWITSENNNNKLHVLKSAHKELHNVLFLGHYIKEDNDTSCQSQSLKHQYKGLSLLPLNLLSIPYLI